MTCEEKLKALEMSGKKNWKGTGNVCYKEHEGVT